MKALLFIRHIISISIVGLNLNVVSVFEELILINKHIVLFSKYVLYTLNVVKFIYKEKTISSEWLLTYSIYISVLIQCIIIPLFIYIAVFLNAGFWVKTVVHEFSDDNTYVYVANSMIKTRMVHPINKHHNKVRMEIP